MGWGDDAALAADARNLRRRSGRDRACCLLSFAALYRTEDGKAGWRGWGLVLPNRLESSAHMNSILIRSEAFGGRLGKISYSTTERWD